MENYDFRQLDTEIGRVVRAGAVACLQFEDCLNRYLDYANPGLFEKVSEFFVPDIRPDFKYVRRLIQHRLGMYLRTGMAMDAVSSRRMPWLSWSSTLNQTCTRDNCTQTSLYRTSSE